MTDFKPVSKFWRRFFRLLLIPIFLLALVPVVLYFTLARPFGSGPAGPEVPAEPFARGVWTERDVLLLGLGDSVTAGFGVQAPYGYVARLADNPPDEFPDMQGKCLRIVLPNLKTLNIAVSGSTSLDHERYIEERLPEQPENVFGIVVMTSGGNDLIHNYGRTKPKEWAMYGATLEEARPWVENFRNRLDTMMHGIKEKFPGGCQIFLADIYDPTDGVGDAVSAFLPDWPDGLKILAEYNRIIVECAERLDFVQHVPMHAVFLGHGTHCTQIWRKNYQKNDPTYWYGINLEDPNIRGYDAIRRVFLIEICRYAEKEHSFGR